MFLEEIFKNLPPIVVALLDFLWVILFVFIAYIALKKDIVLGLTFIFFVISLNQMNIQSSLSLINCKLNLIEAQNLFLMKKNGYKIEEFNDD